MSAPSDSHEAAEKALPRAFKIFWAGQALSAIGDAMTVVAMPLVVFAATSSVEHMGRLTALARVGGVIATAGAGFIVDSWRPRRVMIACDVFRCALLALIPLLWSWDRHLLWLVYWVGISAALAQGIFYVGHVSLVAELVGRARVGLANSRVESSIALAYVCGPFAAGVLSAHFGPTTALGVDSLTFLASAASLIALRSRAREPSPAARPSPSSVLGLSGLRFIRAQPELWQLAILVAACQCLTAALVDLLIYRLKHDLGQGDSGTGTLFGLASGAGVVAALITPWLRAKLAFKRLWVTAVVLQGAALAASAFAQSFAWVASAAALYMAAMTTLMICQASIRQEITPPHLLGRVTSSYLTLVALPTPIGALVGTALAARVGASIVQAGIGVGLLLIAALAQLLWSSAANRELR